MKQSERRAVVNRRGKTETCIRCGVAVRADEDGYEDRMADPNTPAVRIAHGCFYPYGDCVCWECQQKCPITEFEHSRHRAVIKRLTTLMEKGGVIPNGETRRIRKFFDTLEREGWWSVSGKDESTQ